LEQSNGECSTSVKYLCGAGNTRKISHENRNVPVIIPRPERGKFLLIKRGISIKLWMQCFAQEASVKSS
jgi:hypothetical protein